MKKVHFHPDTVDPPPRVYCRCCGVLERAYLGPLIGNLSSEFIVGDYGFSTCPRCHRWVCFSCKNNVHPSCECIDCMFEETDAQEEEEWEDSASEQE